MIGVRSLRDLNACSRQAFLAALAGVFEDSPWVAAAVVDGRPFASPPALHTAMVEAVRRADPQAQLQLLRAHPDLAGRLASAGRLTEASTAEQQSAGLDRLDEATLARFLALNETYHTRFGFPFIVAVRGLDVAEILERFEARLANPVEVERATALKEVAKIARMRLEATLEHPWAG
jgi:2-oxo-4-hydroxy-4-carboxy-5-ureidoimidazoline decarboxylase